MPRSSLETRPLRQRPIPSPKPQGWRRFCRYYYYRLLRLQGTPEAIALGVACGVFAGFFPWFGVQIIVAVILATALRAHKIAAAASTWVSNPFTYVPIFAFNFKVGQWITGWHDFAIDPIDWMSSEIWHFGATFFWTMILGCLLVGSVAALCSYLLAFHLVSRLRHRHGMRGENGDRR